MASDTDTAQIGASEEHALSWLRGASAFLMDLDGVIYTGNTPIPGAREFLHALLDRGRQFQCITNNSTMTATQFTAKLRAMDMPVTESQVLTSPLATAVYLREHVGPGARLFAIGEEGLLRALLDAGFHLVRRAPDAVVCGLDRRLTYDRLRTACTAIRDGARFIATNPDLALPTEHGFIPGNGATLAYIQAATGVPPVMIGKPEATMLHIAMARLGVSPAKTVMVGDSLRTDMLAGARAGVLSVLVLTGVSHMEDASAIASPDLTVRDLVALREMLAGG